MIKRKHFLCSLSAFMLCVSMAGCQGKENPQASTEETLKSTEESVSAEESLETTGESSETIKQTEPDEESSTEEPVNTDPEVSVRDKYLELMSLDIDEARGYFGVKEDSSLTSEDFDEFMDSIFIEAVTSDRLTLDQYLADPAAYGIENIASITYDPGHMIYSEDELAENTDTNLSELKTMLSYPYDALNGRQQLVFDKMYYEYLIALWGGEVKDYSTSLGYTSCIIPNLGITFYEYSFDSEENVKTYARVMDYLPELLLEIPDHVKKQIDELSYAPTDFMIETALDSIEDLMDTDDNPFIDGYNDKLRAMGLDKDKEESYMQANEKFYTEEVIPALSQIYDELSELLGTNPEGKGLCEYEGGLDYYEYLVEDNVGANMTIDELMELLDETIRDNMKMLIRYATFNPDAYEDYIYGNIKLPGNNDPEKILEYLIENLTGEFPSLEGVEWSISPLPESLEIDGVLAYYLVPRIDATDVNVMRVNSSALADDAVTLFTTIAHEGYPGHMLQYNVQQSCGALPVEQIITHLSYSEGWAMYVEKKALDCSGLSEALKTIILIDSDINYGICAYADLAVNGKGWSVEELDEYLDDLGLGYGLGETLYESAVGDPGVYLPYSLGAIITEQIIEDYVSENGGEFSEACVAYLKVGTAPYSVVKKYMSIDY